MPIFLRHKISSVFLLLYFIWWVLVIYAVFLKPANDNHCDFSPLLILFVCPVLAFLYILVLMVRFLQAKRNVYKDDYLIFIGLVTCPLVLGVVWLGIR